LFERCARARKAFSADERLLIGKGPIKSRPHTPPSVCSLAGGRTTVSTLAAQESEKNAFVANQQKRLDYNINHTLKLSPWDEFSRLESFSILNIRSSGRKNSPLEQKSYKNISECNFG
jgi:hypothetical protein